MNAHPLTIQTIVDRQLEAFIGGGINLWETDLGIAPSMLAPGQDASGYIPFADWQDWGYACFDASRDSQDHNHPVVVWDHEQPGSVAQEAPDFFALLVALDGRQRSWNRA